jgi:hypothetical protein
MATPADEAFARDYIAAWSTTADTERGRLVSQLYADDATFFAAEPGDEAIALHGPAAIAENIGRVNARDIRGHGLRIEMDGFAANHDGLRVAWRMVAGDGTVALTGMNLLLRDGAGKIARDYIFVKR